MDSLLIEHGVSGALMIAVGIAAAMWWKWAARAPWRWFGLGVVAWVVAILGKTATALIVNPPVIGYLQHQLEYPAYMAVGSIYIGLLTGIFEIGIIWAVGSYWRSAYAAPGNALAVGFGAGAFEAMLLGMAVVISVLVAQVSDEARAAVGEMLAATYQLNALPWALAPVERVLTIPCHVASRALVLYGLATGRKRHFVYGFALLTAIDTIAGYVHLSGFMQQYSIWWVELAIAPFAILSIVTAWTLYRRWPETRQGDTGATPAAGAD